MSELDFDQIARTLDAELDDNPAGLGNRFLAARLDVIKTALRQVWNARGTADAAAVAETMKYYQYGSDAAIVETLGHTLRALDST